MCFSRGSIHLPINSPLWREAVYTGRRVSGKEKSGRVKKESKWWEMSGACWHGRMDGWRHSNESRGRRAERKERRLEGKAIHVQPRSVSYCGSAG